MSRIEALLEQMQREIDSLEKKIGSLETAEYNRLTNLYIIDGSDAPSAASGWAIMYIDATDGDLKIIFEDSTIKTIVTDA